MPRMSEQQLVEHIKGYLQFKSNSRYPQSDPQDRSADAINADINSYLRTKHIRQGHPDYQTLYDALAMQHNALTFLQNPPDVSSRYSGPYVGGSNIDLIIFPGWPYSGGCWGHHHHFGGGGSSFSGGGCDGDAALVMLIVILAGSAIAAGIGMCLDLAEIGDELNNKERVAANVATLALTAAAVVGAVAATAALLASNPVGWAVAGSLAVFIGLALVVKGVRALVNTIDAGLTQESGVAHDSRFQLSIKEEVNLTRNCGATPEEIEKIKGIIRGLAVQASSMQETSFFGSNDKYREVIKVLIDVKNGKIPPGMQAQYGLTEFAERQHDGHDRRQGFAMD